MLEPDTKHVRANRQSNPNTHEWVKNVGKEDILGYTLVSKCLTSLREHLNIGHHTYITRGSRFFLMALPLQARGVKDRPLRNFFLNFKTKVSTAIKIEGVPLGQEWILYKISYNKNNNNLYL